LFDAVWYKLEGGGFEVIGFFNWGNSSNPTMAVRSTQSVIEMNTRNFPEGKGLPGRKADNLTSIDELTI
jgi:hypothetical protein